MRFIETNVKDGFFYYEIFDNIINENFQSEDLKIPLVKNYLVLISNSKIIDYKRLNVNNFNDLPNFLFLGFTEEKNMKTLIIKTSDNKDYNFQKFFNKSTDVPCYIYSFQKIITFIRLFFIKNLYNIFLQ